MSFFSDLGFGPERLASGVLLVGVLGALAWIDIRTLRLPDALTLSLLCFGLLRALAGVGAAPFDAAVGAAVGFGVFWLLGEVYFRARGVDGLGLGDAKLLGAAGAWLGWMLLPYVVLGAALPALAAAVLAGPERDRAMAFGPWLCASFAGVWWVAGR